MKIFVPKYMRDEYTGVEIKGGKWTRVKIHKHPYIFFHVNDPLEWSAYVWRWADKNHVEHITDINGYGRLFTQPDDDLKKFLEYVTNQLKRHRISFPKLDYDTPAQGWADATWDEVES